MSLSEIDHQIQDHEAAIQALKEKKEALSLLTEEQQLAIRLHETYCKFNHTDGCGWYYDEDKGVHNWTGPEHRRYLEKANKVIKLCKDNNVPTEFIFKIKEVI